MNLLSTIWKTLALALLLCFFIQSANSQSYNKREVTGLEHEENETSGLTLHPTKVNLVVLGDGYGGTAGDQVSDPEDDEIKFVNSAHGALFGHSCGICLPQGLDYNPEEGMFDLEPFRQYRNYFNIYTVFTKGHSAAVGVREDCMATDHCAGSCTAGQYNGIMNYWGTTYDYKASVLSDAYHRSIAIRDDDGYGNQNEDYGSGAANVVDEVLNTVYSGETYGADYNNLMLIMLANSQLTRSPNRRHGGSGGMNINNTGIGLTVFPANLEYAGTIGIHEFAHSFSLLYDEYWPGTHFADDGPNMSTVEDPTVWDNWVGGNDIEVYPHYTELACDNNYDTQVTGWWKPTSKDEVTEGNWDNPKCRMESIGQNFCVVCREAIVEALHDKVPLLQSYSPDNDMVLTPTDGGSDIDFRVTLLKPNLEYSDYNFNTVDWVLDEDYGNPTTHEGWSDLVTNEDYYQITLDCSPDGIFSGLSEGVHILEAIVQDNSPYVHDGSAGADTYHELYHIDTIRWVINYRPKCCSTYTEAITGPETWDDPSMNGNGSLGSLTVSSYVITGEDFEVTGTLTLEADLTLTNCNVRMGDEALIVVDPGVIFTLNNTNLYACSNIWEGIKVLGDPDASQTSGNQGKILVNTGSEISDARWGVMVASGEGENGETGGIIQASGATFRNNRKDVAFMQYTFEETDSYFDDCDFITDAPLNSTHYYNYTYDLYGGGNSHVSVWGINGLTFEDCNFFCDLDDSWPSGSPDGYYYPFNYITRAQGISYADAKLFVGGSGVGNNFTNLINGMDGFNTSYTVLNADLTVEYNTFTNCEFGVNMHTAFGNQIKNNTFDLPWETGWEPQNDNIAVGVNAWMCHNSLIKDNIFDTYENIQTSNMNYATHTVGVNVHGSDANSRVTFNDFSKLQVGTQAEDYNLDLEILCNDYNTSTDDNDVDWLINPNYESQDILGPQGTGCDAVDQYRAGNKFYDQTNENIVYGDPTTNPFLYESADGLTANASNDDETPKRYDSDGQQQTNGITECNLTDPDITCGTIILLQYTIPEMEDTLRILDTAWSDLLDESTIVIANLDSGVTDTVLKRIDDATVSNANLTDSLINYWSPLSDESLLAVTERDPFFTATQYHDIIIANSPVSKDVWPSLVDASASAFPDSVISAQGTDTIRTVTVLEWEAALLNTAIRKFEADILYLYVDGDSTPVSIINYMLDSLNNPEREIVDKQYYTKLAIGTAISVDSIDWARDILEDSLNLTDANDTAFYDYHDLALDLLEADTTWFGISSSQRTKLLSIAATSYDVAPLAQNVLRLVDDSVYARLPRILSLPRLSSYHGEQYSSQDVTQQSEKLTGFNVYPNPFSNSFNVTYQLDNEARELKLEVFDLLGRNVHKEIQYNNSEGTRTIDMGNCLGVYILRMTADNKVVYQTKVLCSQN